MPLSPSSDLKHSSSTTLPSPLSEDDGPLELKYGYYTEPLRTLEMGQVEEIVKLCGKQIKQRGEQAGWRADRSFQHD